MSTELNEINEKANLKQYPETRREPEGRFIILPDIHGCTLKLIYSLVKEGIFKFNDPDDYTKIVGICERASTLSKEDAEAFKTILSSIEVRSPHRLNLLGDLLADRGLLGNDYLTLKVIEKLGTGQVNYRINWSNHDAEFLSRLQGEHGNITNQSQSITSLFKFLLHYPNELYSQEVENIVNQYYKPKLEILGGAIISSQPPKFLHLSHAPTDASTTQANLVDYFNIPPEAEETKQSNSELANFISQRAAINTQFRKAIEDGLFFQEWQKQVHAWNPKTLNNPGIPLYPIIIPAWNREVPDDEAYKNIGEHEVFHVHGHSSDDEKPQKRINLDNDNLLGHSGSDSPAKGNYHIYSCKGAQTMEEYLGTTNEVLKHPEKKKMAPESKPLAKFREASFAQDPEGALDFIVQNGYWDALPDFLRYQPTMVNHINSKTGMGLLHHAVEQNVASAVQQLIAQKADVNLYDRFGCTPLHLCEDKAIRSQLLKARAKPTKAPAYQKNPQFLADAVQDQEWAVVRFLLGELECPVTGSCSDKYSLFATPGAPVLQQLMWKDQWDLVRTLLRRSDVAINAKTPGGVDAREIAETYNSCPEDIRNCLQNQKNLDCLKSPQEEKRRKIIAPIKNHESIADNPNAFFQGLQITGKLSLISSISAAALLITLEIAATGDKADWATKALFAEPGAGLKVEDILIACSFIAVPYLLYLVVISLNLLVVILLMMPLRYNNLQATNVIPAGGRNPVATIDI